jgi:cyclophilin family peptidyl-prolyl cis-trans isomerase
MKKMQYSQPPAMTLDREKSYQAVVRTDRGEMRLDLFADKAPRTVNNFVFLAKQGFYDGVIFHRVIRGFMAQTGDPTGTGRGGPGYSFEDEIHPELRHDGPGVVSMANAGPNTNGSQFFLTHAATPWLDGKHTVFGRIVSGMEVLLSIPERDPAAAGAPAAAVQSIEILES